MANEHSLRQVCHARTSYGESRAFLWQPLRFFSPHGCSPFTGAKLDFLTITRARWARLCGAEGAGQTQRLFPPSLRAPRTLLDCQAADSTAAILWGGKKTVATQQNAGWVVVVFFFLCRTGATARKQEPCLRQLLQICPRCTEKRGCRSPPEPSEDRRAPLCLRSFPRHDKQQHGQTAATALQHRSRSYCAIMINSSPR